jgi:hypothetical protein
MNKIDVRPMIRREMIKRHDTSTDIARALQKNPASIRGSLNRPTMQLNRLAELPDFFQYNFFREIAVKIPYSQTDYSVAVDRTEIETLRNQVKDLEFEIKILKQVIKDLKVK